MILRVLHTDLGLDILELNASTSWSKEIIWVIYEWLIYIMADFYFHFYTFSPFSYFFSIFQLFYNEHVLLNSPEKWFSTYQLCFLDQLSPPLYLSCLICRMGINILPQFLQ